MAFGTQDDSDDVMNEINMTPLVDVMLVLLIVFIITVPVMKHAVNVDLPRASNEPEVVKPQNISLSIDAQGQYHWNKEAISDEQLVERLTAEAAKVPQPESARLVLSQSLRSKASALPDPKPCIKRKPAGFFCVCGTHKVSFQRLYINDFNIFYI